MMRGCCLSLLTVLVIIPDGCRQIPNGQLVMGKAQDNSDL